MSTSTINVKKTATAFGTALGNGAKAGEIFKEAIDHVIASGDTSVIVNMRDKAMAKGDHQAARAVMRTFGLIFVGAKVNATKDKKSISIQIKDATRNNFAIDALASLVADKVSIRGDKWAKAFIDDTQEVAKATPQALALSMAKRADKEEVTIEALIAALQVVAKERKEAAKAKTKETADA